MEPISVNFQLTEKEFLSACRLLSFTTGLKIRLAVITLMLGVTLFLLLLVLNFDPQSSLFASILVLLVVSSLLHSARTALPRRVFRGDHKFRDAMTLTFTDECVGVRMTEIESRLGWKLYTDVLECESCYVLVYGKDIRTMTAVPKRAFRSEEQERDFRRLVFPRFGKELAPPRKGTTIESNYEPPSLQPPDWR
jgi:hypothetical protein